MPSSHLILCCPLLLPPSISPSIRVFSNEWVLRIRWPKYWSFSFSISPSNEYSGLISFMIDWFDFLAVSSQQSHVSYHIMVQDFINSPKGPRTDLTIKRWLQRSWDKHFAKEIKAVLPSACYSKIRMGKWPTYKCYVYSVLCVRNHLYRYLGLLSLRATVIYLLNLCQ